MTSISKVMTQETLSLNELKAKRHQENLRFVKFILYTDSGFSAGALSAPPRPWFSAAWQPGLGVCEFNAAYTA